MMMIKGRYIFRLPTIPFGTAVVEADRQKLRVASNNLAQMSAQCQRFAEALELFEHAGAGALTSTAGPLHFVEKWQMMAARDGVMTLGHLE